MEMTPGTWLRSCTPGFRATFPGREIGGQRLHRLATPADPRRSIPASTGASADRADISWSWSMGDGFPACWAFGAAGMY